MTDGYESKSQMKRVKILKEAEKMPVYEYHCEAHQITETVFPMGEAPESILCPICEESIPRVFSVPGITFNGTGFYKTDNR